MRYATLSNNRLHYAPRKLHIGNQWVWNPTEQMLLSEGYLPVIETEPPEAPEGHYYVSGWERQGDQIVQIWTLEELPPEPDDISPDEALDIILGGGET